MTFSNWPLQSRVPSALGRPQGASHELSAGNVDHLADTGWATSFTARVRLPRRDSSTVSAPAKLDLGKSLGSG